MGNIEKTTKISRLKGISSIEDKYVECKKIKILQYSQEKNCVGVSF